MPPNKENAPSGRPEGDKEILDGKKFRKLITEVLGHGLTYHAVERAGLRIEIHKDFVLRREVSSISGEENSIHKEKVWVIKVLEITGAQKGSGYFYKTITSESGRNSKESLRQIARRMAPMLYEKDPRIGWRSLGPDCPLFDNLHFLEAGSRPATDQHWWGGGIVGWVTDSD